MANITGTNGNDTLTATNGDDVIKGLGGNDTIITSGVGNDFIDGGAGSDVVDYSSNTSENGINVRLNSNGSFLADHLIGFDTNGVPTGITDTIVNVETIIGNAASSFSNGLSFSNA
jgi:Ca2+-binding RTX toxin-like protein